METNGRTLKDGGNIGRRMENNGQRWNVSDRKFAMVRFARRITHMDERT
jgi:hypothetical protein